MDMNVKLAELLDFGLSRSKRNSVAPAGAIASRDNVGLGRAFAQTLSDTDILNFALTLEHLEARMYRDMLATNILTGKEMTYFQDFGAAEAAHVTAITQTLNSLGVTPVAEQQTYNFPAFSDRAAILNFAKVAEDIGVGAYQGAAAAISNPQVLAAAGSIVQVEARHAAIVNILLGQAPAPAATTSSLTVQEVLNRVNPILGAQ
jgi:rubrerythrin